MEPEWLCRIGPLVLLSELRKTNNDFCVYTEKENKAKRNIFKTTGQFNLKRNFW